MTLRKELLIALGIVLLGWVVLMAGVGRWQRSRAERSVTVEPELPRYPGTEAAEEQTSPNLGFRKYWFKLNEDYPSQSVFHYYQQQLGPKGWRLLGQAEPKWRRQQEADRFQDVFRATWLDPKGLFQLDLEMLSTVHVVKHELGGETEQREPGLKVYVTLRRNLFPGLIMPPEETSPRGKGIESR